MPLELEDPIIVGAQLVLRRDLRGEAHERVAHELLLDRWIARLVLLVRHSIERIGHAFVHRHVSSRGEEPELVADDRPARVDVEVLHVLDEVAIEESPGLQRIVVVVALPAVRGAADEAAAFEEVPAVFGDHVDAHAAGCDFRGQRARLEDDALRERIVVVGLDVAVAHGAVHVHAVHLHARVAIVGPVRPHVGLLHPLRSADVRTTELHARNRRADGLHVPRRRQRVEHGALERVRALGVLHVDQGRLARDRHALLDRAHLEIDVDRDRRVAGQLDAGAHDGRESGERERHRISAGAQIDDRVSPGAVGDDRTRLLDQHGARGFDGHTRQYRVARVSDDARKRALRGCR